jgi:flagellar biosynthesis/type III secretory pathway protein FliH
VHDEVRFEQLEPVDLAGRRPGPAAASSDVLAAAEAEAGAIRATARAEGLEEGRAAARAEAQEQLAPAAAALAAALETIAAERDRAVDALEEAAVELGLQVAEKVLAGALAVQPERVIDVVRGALRGIIERERVQVLVHPEDLELVSEAGTAIAAELGGIERFEVQAEQRVARGGAVVRTSDGEVDGSIATKLERVRETVAAELAA